MADTFRVHPAALRTFGKRLDDAIAKVEQAAEYLHTTSPSWGGPGFGAAEALKATHDEVLTQMRALVHQIHGGTLASQEAITAIARRYEGTDDKHSVSMQYVQERVGHETARTHEIYQHEVSPHAGLHHGPGRTL